MIFSSLVFLCAFLPITYALYLILPGIKAKNVLLIIVSLFFYAYGEPVYVFLMIFSTIINYISARLLTSLKYRKAVIVLCLIVNLGILCVFKYTGFLLNTVNEIFSISLPIPEITLPIGISFFTFQALSYVLDVYDGKVEAQKNYFNILLYVAFFPQLIAGPIVKYRDINEELADRKITYTDAAEGLRRFICGLSKKVIIANTVGQIADNIFTADLSSLNFIAAWLGATAYMLQIYFDFSGYSDMAIGLGKMFGFHFMENFNYPYAAVGIKNFWRKWHITLSTWFKEYLYIPLGGNRKGKLRACINRLIVFFFTGLWHGANWTFVVWGLFHGFFLLVEEFVPLIKKMPKLLVRIYTLAVVCIGFVIFRADTIGDAVQFISKMFTSFDVDCAGTSLALTQLTPWCIFILAVGIVSSSFTSALSSSVKQHLSSETRTAAWKAVNAFLYILSVPALFICIVELSASSYNPFIYFRF